MPNNHRLLLGLLLATPLGLLAALASGSLALGPDQLWQALSGGGEPLLRGLVLDLRLPRALAALICGGLLALAGALIQVLLRNPLGDPYVLGISGGASAGALAALLLNSPLLPLTPAAALGALVSLLLVFGLTSARGWSIQRLLLTGVVIAAGWGALISLVLALSPSERLPGMLFWLMGDLSTSQGLLGPGLILLGGLLIGLLLAPQLNLLLQGELQAAALGVEVRRLRIILFLLSSVLTASAVTLAGSIGFIGLVAPHLFRLLGGSDHRLLLPGALLIGGLLLLLADTLARSLIAPQQLPLGALTALIGVPLFLYLLNRR
ncbi:iron ABC transporter permease [Magnetovirga frankeli]|uniref:FecCD family ABC transporter permease n=1 Tax=Magnetovirga frankeli TaxID=947516 RepID=UPI0012934B15|nr:iron ABC transporter permease [gamma proteobacterium SS-5]